LFVSSLVFSASYFSWSAKKSKTFHEQIPFTARNANFISIEEAFLHVDCVSKCCAKRLQKMTTDENRMTRV
jgi:hypothetical protein